MPYILLVSKTAGCRSFSPAEYTTTMHTPQPDTKTTAYETYKTDVESLRSFEYAERSHASTALFSRGSGWMKQRDSATADLLLVLGRMAQTHRSLVGVSLQIARSVNPHASRGEWEGKLFQTAREALLHNYDDVELRSGPESYRHSECQRPYTVAEKLVVLEALNSLCYQYPGQGWASRQLAAELGIQHSIDRIQHKR